MIRIRIRAEDADPRNILLKALSEREMWGVCEDAARAGLEVLAREARSRAPVDTGKLRASIKVVMYGAKDGVVSGAVEVGEYYAAFVEFGTADQPARPFIRPAIMAADAKAWEAASTAIRKDLGAT